MIGASKILTVSYGTFSCTLEGFDDPFNTMRAIAEYFRDLAAEDRYFGAEPPTPDAAMLHQIAEREIHRRVEAKIQENGVILRAGDGPFSESAAPPRAELAAPAPVAAEPVAPVAPVVVAAAPALSPGENAISESVAAKLMRIRTAVAQAKPAAEPIAPDAYSEDQHAAEPDAAPDFAPLAVVQAGLPEEDAAQLQAMLAPDEVLPEDFAAAAPAETEGLTAAEPEAALLANLGDLVARQSADVAPDAPAAPLAEVTAEITSVPGPVLTQDSDGWVEDEESWAATDLSDLAALNADLTGLETAETDAETDAAADLTAAEPAPASVFEQDAQADAAEAEAIAAIMADTDAEPAAKPALSEKALRARARVIKIRRGDAATETPPSAASLSPEAEADLMRELAEVERDIIPPAAQLPGPVRPASLARPAPTASQPMLDTRDQLIDTASDAAVNRLIAQTNTEMAGPENSRRRSAIAHLKAAVVATIADRKSGGTPPPSETERAVPYRSDLTRLVRPAGNGMTGERPAPLVLVSAQRIDRLPEVGAQQLADATKPVVRPRRVSVASNLAVQDDLIDGDDDDTAEDTDLDAGNIFHDTKGFAEFADRLGAQGLPALLEAAAAYTACVEGRPYFTRPHLMHKISALAPEGGFNREDSLRGFGNLLRVGKITKVKRGQFALAESSHYLVEARKLLG